MDSHSYFKFIPGFYVGFISNDSPGWLDGIQLRKSR